MGAVVFLDREKAARQRTGHHAGRYSEKKGEPVNRVHSASARGFEAAGDVDHFARLQWMFEGDPGRQATDFLRQCQQVQCANTGLLVSLMAVAAAIATNVLNQTADLLHRASVLSSRNSLAGTHAKKFTNGAENVRP